MYFVDGHPELVCVTVDLSSASELSDNDSDDSDSRELSGYSCRHCYTTSEFILCASSGRNFICYSRTALHGKSSAPIPIQHTLGHSSSASLHFSVSMTRLNLGKHAF